MALYQRALFTSGEVNIPLREMNYSDRQDKMDHDRDVDAILHLHYEWEYVLKRDIPHAQVLSTYDYIAFWGVPFDER